MVLRPKPSGSIAPSVSRLPRYECCLAYAGPGQGVRSRCLGALDRGGGSSRRLRCFWIWPNSSSMSGTVISGRRVPKQASQGDFWPVGEPLTKACGSSKQTSAPLSPSGPLGQVFQVAVALGPCHYLLRQMWSGVLGTRGRALPQLQRISWWPDLAAAQIEVGAVSKQTLPWFGARASAHPGRSDDFGSAVGILRGGFGPNSDGAVHTQEATSAPQAAGLDHWERIAEAATTEELALQRWDPFTG